MRKPLPFILAALAAGTIFTLSACGSGHASDRSSAAAGVSSFAANPTVSADTAQLENELLTAYKADFKPAHPVQSMETAVKQVFPQGDASKIATYAVQQLTPGMIHSKSDRQAWAQKVVTYALGPSGAASPSPSGTPLTPAPPSPAVSKTGASA